jgi:hypothetical protein
MSITIDDKAAYFFKIYDELTQTYLKEIDSYKTLVKAVAEMIDQKEKDLQDIKDKVISLMKQSITSPEAEVPQEDDNIADTAAEPSSPEVAPSTPVIEKKPTLQKKKKVTAQKEDKVTARSKTLPAEKKINKPKSAPVKKTEKSADSEKTVTCLHHPKSPAVDIGKRLCASCKWKIRANGLMGHDKDPAVVSFLKGETQTVPLVGQPMCPIHPTTPAYNKKTGLCTRCQSKARTIGISDRRLTDEELFLLQNPSL